MTSFIAQKRITAPMLMQQKGAGKIVCLTAYTAPMARLLDAHVDVLLVGDSLGMVLYGFESTLPVTLEMMCAHASAVVQHSQRAFVLVDLPFASYQQSKEQAFASAAMLMQQTGCHGVKLEGGMEMVETVRFLSQRGIPVMAHIGLCPQMVHQMGGYRTQGRDEAAATALMQQAEAFEQAGAFGLLLEGMRESVAARITKAVRIPTIGIGASPECDGQVLVSEDMLGLHAQTPRFVKRFAEMESLISQAAAAYAAEVRAGSFPAPEHCFTAKTPTTGSSGDTP